jgi:aryl-alcohol dehydrogenase-like predicted oxidoreductase
MTLSTFSLGRTRLQVSPMGIGAWSWGDSRTWGYGRTHTEADVQAAFETGLAAGISLFDTAKVYGVGQSELLLGRFIKAARRPVIVATKFMPFPWRLRRGELMRALQKSLDRLSLARVDLYQIHWPFPPIPIGAKYARRAQENVGALDAASEQVGRG